MATVRKYIQYAMDALLADGKDYEVLADLYFESLGIVIQPESLKRAHRRGNLPSGVAPDEFYDEIILNYYSSVELLKIWAIKFNKLLDRDGMFPDEWKAQKEEISGDSEKFDPGLFRTYVECLLAIDKKGESSKKTKTKADSFALSKKFFNDGALALVGASKKQIEEELRKLSAIFYPISTLEFLEEEFSYNSEDMLSKLCAKVIEETKKEDTEDILKIKGPLGSYKNRVMQYLYIAISKERTDILPFYIDVAYYERMAEGDEKLSEADFFNAFEKDIEKAEEIVRFNPDKIPLLMLDGIRDFSCLNESLYYAINERINRHDFKFIVCEDTDFTVNNHNIYEIHPIVSNDFDIYFRIRSVNLNRKAESIEFIKNCIEVFGVEISDRVTPELIYESLVRLDFMTIDAYWLVYILNESLTDIINAKNNISGIYNSLCLKFLGSHKQVLSAAEYAFNFEIGKASFDNTNPYYDLRWRLIKKHRSVLDFLIAKYYTQKLKELDFSSSHEQNVEKLSFFNMVLQKRITRFIVNLIKGDQHYEKQIMIIAKKYYDDLGLFGKSELTLWMGRLESKVRKEDCVQLLKGYNKKARERYEKNNFKDPSDKRDLAFLIRGITVSLIYLEDREALQYYAKSLLEDKIANSVNRGFHLEYYGDKPYVPHQSLLDFEDDVTKGDLTMTALCLELDKRMRKNDPKKLVPIIEVFTLCSLIQARMEASDEAKTMDVTPYIGKCIKYLKWIMNHKMLRGFYDISRYFSWMYQSLSDYKKEGVAERKPSFNRSDIINKYSKGDTVKRNGWAERNILDAENIVEHMYHCWLMGMIYLPEESELEGYSKNDILNMLLIHDIAEIETGDITRPQKATNKEHYDRLEQKAMYSFLLSGTFPKATSLSKYMNLWQQWSAKTRNINAMIAKEIDEIQTIYRFCEYYLQYPDILDCNEISYWLSNIHSIESDIGKDILDAVVLNNAQFKQIVDEYNNAEES